MPATERETMDPRQASDALEAVRALLARSGLAAEAAVEGWRITGVELANRGTVAVVRVARGAATFGVRIRRASERPRFTRVGDVDLEHEAVEDELGSAAASVTRAVARSLERAGGAAELPALLADPSSPAVQGRDPSAEASAEVSAEPSPAEVPPPLPGAMPYAAVQEAPPLDPAMEAPPDRPVIHFDYIDVDELDRFPDALREMYEGRRGGLVVRGVYSKDEVARVVERLQANEEAFPIMQLPANQRSHFLGLCLEGGDPTLTDYLASAERFREQAVRVFDGMAPFEERIEGVLRRLAGDRRVELTRYHDGRAYTPATIRILPAGAQLAPHCGNEMYARPSYEHLNSVVDTHDQLSYFVTLQEAEEGGGLIIYSLKWHDVGGDHVLPDRRSNVGELLGQFEWTEVRPRAGDMLIFDGGRYLHRVDWVKGGRTRWTMGGFLMFDRAGETLLYFA